MVEMFDKFKNGVGKVEDLAPLVFRLLLAYVFYGTAIEKLGSIEGTAYWFESLGIPFHTLNAYMAAITETAGFVLLFLGLGTRFISIGLIFVMIVALLTVHIDNGWLVIGSSLNDPEVASRVGKAKEILKEFANYDWITAKGSLVVLQNGMEFVVTYIAMLLSLIFTGPGKISVDAIIESKMKK